MKVRRCENCRPTPSLRSRSNLAIPTKKKQSLSKKEVAVLLLRPIDKLKIEIACYELLQLIQACVIKQFSIIELKNRTIRRSMPPQPFKQKEIVLC